MAEKIKSALPPDLDLGGGWTVEWDAVDPATGATVPGVIISKTSLLVPGDYGGGGGGIEAATPYLLVPGPGDSSGLQFGGGTPPPPTGEPPPPPPPPSPPPPVSTPVPVGSLIFGDDFNGSAGAKPDATKWGARTGGSNGLAHYNGTTNLALDGHGNLVVTCLRVGGVWQSGFISTKAGYSGPRYCETRAKVAAGVGAWSAPLWEWPYPYGAAPGIENDVNEQLGRQPDAYHATLHNWNKGSDPLSGHLISTGVPLAAGFHVYGSAVYHDRIDYYFDGKKMATAPASAVGLTDLTTSKVVAVIDLNIGGWGGTPTITGPISMLVDYVHVYKLA